MSVIPWFYKSKKREKFESYDYNFKAGISKCLRLDVLCRDAAIDQIHKMESLYTTPPLTKTLPRSGRTLSDFTEKTSIPKAGLLFLSIF